MTGKTVSAKVRIPKGIRFECSGCANCCFGWPVPLTRDDVGQLTSIPGAPEHIRRLSSGNGEFFYTFEKPDSGDCAFLTDAGRCRIQSAFGVEKKPSMCRLFPWSFSFAPDGVSAYLSFASTAVLENRGSLLSEQGQEVEAMKELFLSLFPEECLWNDLQIFDGLSMPWEQFVSFEEELLTRLHGTSAVDESPRSVSFEVQRFIKLLLPRVSHQRKALPKLEARPKVIDQLLLCFLDRLLLPEKVYSTSEFDLDSRRLVAEIVNAPNVVKFHGLRFQDVMDAVSDNESFDDLVDRFLYSRIFARLYFGPGFHHLSFVVGLRLFLVFSVVLRLRAAADVVSEQIASQGPGTGEGAGGSGLSSSSSTPENELELLRTLERRITQLQLSGQTIAVLEVLLSCDERMERIMSMCG